MNTSSIIRGMGHYLPEKVLTNNDLEKMVDTSDEWITTRTGIKTRHIAAPDEACSDVALQASRRALADAGMAPDDITHVLVATLTPDYFCPNTAGILADKLGIKSNLALDVNAACSGFLYTLQLARGILSLEPDAKVLVAAAEVLSGRVNWKDRATCVLFGDGAGAVVLTSGEPEPGQPRIDDLITRFDGAYKDLLVIPESGSAKPYLLGETVTEDNFITMGGSEVFKFGVRAMEDISKEMLEKHGLTIDDVDLFIPHQANLRIIEAVAKRVGFRDEQVFVNVNRYGNTSAASVAIAMSEAQEQKRIKPGSLVLATTFGGGFTWGSVLLSC